MPEDAGSAPSDGGTMGSPTFAGASISIPAAFPAMPGSPRRPHSGGLLPSPCPLWGGNDTSPHDVLTFLGTGDAPGTPRLHCGCAVCEGARKDPSLSRSRSSALIQGSGGRLLIDCGPDLRSQLEAQTTRRLPEDVLLTHAHHDHIGGIPDLSDACLWSGQKVVVHAPSVVIEEVQRRYPWVGRSLTFSAVDAAWRWGSWGLSVWSVSHGANGRSHAYRFDRPPYAFAYCPDSFRLTEEELAPMQGVDLLVIGATHLDESMAPPERRSLYSVREIADLLPRLAARQAIITHMSHTVPASGLPALPAGMILARDGLEVPLEAAPS